MSYRLFAIFIFFIVSCGRQDNDPRLIKIAENISVSPKEALADLDAINSDALNDSDRHLYDFLTTRVRDKEHHKKLNRQLEKVADSFGNITDI